MNHPFRRKPARVNPVTTALLGLLIVAAAAASWRLTRPAQPKPVATAEPEPAQPAIPWFVDVATKAGIDFVHVPGKKRRYYFPEIMSSGTALFDYDNDGDLDLYLLQSGELQPDTPNQLGNKLYRNRGDGTFEDVTAASGTSDTGYGVGCAAGDYDDDGDVDLYITNVGTNVLYRNNGDGTFSDVTRDAHVGDAAWGTSAAFLDYDTDGDLDLYVVNYLNWSVDRELECAIDSGMRDYCHPNNYKAPAPDTLYRNNGDGTFQDVSETSGVRKIFGNGLGVATGDFNGDGRIDIYVANDGMPNQLWINDGGHKFHDDALMAGCAVNNQGQSEGGMGVAAVDANNDGDLDLFLSHLNEETNTFYRNDGKWFDDTTAAMGLTGPSIGFTGFGLGFADFNQDGMLDIYVANGRVRYIDPPLDPKDVYVEPNQLYTGQPGWVFREVFPRGGTEQLLIGTSRAAAFGDLDGDGDTDIVVCNVGAAPYILKNIAPRQGNWVMFRVLKPNGGYAIGAMVRIEANGKTLSRIVQRAYSYCASNDPRVHFGLGNNVEIQRAIVHWPDGAHEMFGPFDAGAIHDLRRGAGRFQNAP